ncbi:hypothetical protein, partial [Salinicola salarius]|uniref:hypothetical protein n=1 Tax=Salinicola salarius TaxID=430457 RepID=UPI0026F0BD24
GESLRCAVLERQPGRNPHLYLIGSGSCAPGALRFILLADLFSVSRKEPRSAAGQDFIHHSFDTRCGGLLAARRGWNRP